MIEIKYDDGDILFFRDIKHIRYNHTEKYLCVFGADDIILWGGKANICNFAFAKNNINFNKGENINTLNDIDKVMMALSDDYCLIVEPIRVDYFHKKFSE